MVVKVKALSLGDLTARTLPGGSAGIHAVPVSGNWYLPGAFGAGFGCCLDYRNGDC